MTDIVERLRRGIDWNPMEAAAEIAQLRDADRRNIEIIKAQIDEIARLRGVIARDMVEAERLRMNNEYLKRQVEKHVTGGVRLEGAIIPYEDGIFSDIDR